MQIRSGGTGDAVNQTIMKKLFSIAVLCMLFSAACAQSNVTTFLGIPVDGTKAEMIQKLKAKGYTLDSSGEYLTGEFNGRDVNIYVVTNNNKVYRIMVADANNIYETDIRIRFNKLCSQFENNGRYVKMFADEDYYIPEDEDISYNMAVNNKRYQAAYYQCPQNQYLQMISSQEAIAKRVTEISRSRLLEKYTEEQLADTLNRTEEMSNDMVRIISETMVEQMALGEKQSQEQKEKNLEEWLNNRVWFIISEFRGKYSIVMYYDNTRNEADGSEL